MDRLSPSDPAMQPDPADDESAATIRMPLPDEAGDWVPAPASWSDANRRRQEARADACEGLRRLARMVEPVLRAEARPAPQPVPVDIDLPLTVEDAASGWSRLSPTDESAETAVNDAFQPLDMSMLSGERLNPAGVRFIDELPEAIRPVCTATRHPHIINKLAVIRDNAKALGEYFDELLISSRPTRRGFSLEVMAELFGLQRRLQGSGEGAVGNDLSMRG